MLWSITAVGAIWRLRRGSERLTRADYKRLALLGFRIGKGLPRLRFLRLQILSRRIEQCALILIGLFLILNQDHLLIFDLPQLVQHCFPVDSTG